MAKKKAAKAKAKLLRLRQIVDDDDPWSEIPSEVCVQCGIARMVDRRHGTFSYVRGEEPGWLAQCALQEHGFAPLYTQYWVPNFRAWLRSAEWPNAKAWKGGKWPKGSKWRDYK